MGNVYQGAATCNRRKFCCKFVIEISVHFRVYFRLHLADHSDLGIGT